MTSFIQRTPAPPKVLVPPTPSSPVIAGSSLSLPASDTANTDLAHQHQQPHAKQLLAMNHAKLAMMESIASPPPLPPPTPQVIHEAEKFLSLFQKAESLASVPPPAPPAAAAALPPLPGKASSRTAAAVEILAAARLPQELRQLEELASMGSAAASNKAKGKTANEHDQDEEEDYADEFLTGQTQVRKREESI